MVICLVLALVLVILSIFLLCGKGAWLIAGYNTASEAEKAQYDTKKLCRGGGVLLLVCGVLVGLMGLFLYGVESGRLPEEAMLPFTGFFLVVLLLSIVWLFRYTNKHAKK